MDKILDRSCSLLRLPFLSGFAYGLALLLLLLRLSTPSDGARLVFGPSLSDPTSVSVTPLVANPDGFKRGDVVTQAEGIAISHWMRTIFDITIPSANWKFGESVDYTIWRSDRVQHVVITLDRFPIGSVLLKNAPVAIFLLLMQIQVVWMWWQRRQEMTTQTLLLAASAFNAFSICWYVGMDLASLISGRGLFMFYRLVMFCELMLMSAALIHFAIVLTNPNLHPKPLRRLIILIYLAPYPIYLVYLALIYTPDPLAWLRRWEYGSIGLIALAFILTLLALAWGYHQITAIGTRARVRVVVLAFALAILIATILGVAPMLRTGHLGLEWQVVPLLSLPVALGLGVSVVFYRLFDLRVVMQRTLVWGMLTVLIVVTYVWMVGALSTLFQMQGNPIFSLIATGIVAILFASVRMRLQHGVNWLLYGERDTPYQVITRLSNRLEQTLTPDKALAQIAQTIANALKLPYAAIELCQEDSYICLASWGKRGIEYIEYPLSYGGETVGRLIVAPRSPGEVLTSGDHNLLTGLLYHAETTIQTARLTTALQHSRENLVMMREEERRRLRRDLHDGLGPALASLTLQIDAARNRLKSDPAQVEPLLIDIKAQIRDALTDIRRLVYELRPPTLDQLGLCATIIEKTRELERVSNLRIQVEMPASLPPLSAAAEVALYRICMEAITNVIHHADATICQVRLTCNGRLRLEICDNGRGLPEDFRYGIGLSSMVERASELGGICLVECREEGGTRVCAELPLSNC